MLSSVQQPHKSNHGKSLSHSHQVIKALINLGAAFQNKLRVTVNPFVAQGLLPHQHHLHSREGSEEGSPAQQTGTNC